MTEKELTALEAIQKVKEAEARAKSILEETRSKEIPEIMAKAAEEAKAVAEEILAGAKEEAEKRKQMIIAQAKKQAEEIRKETREEIEKIEKTAEEKFASSWPSILQLIRREIESSEG